MSYGVSKEIEFCAGHRVPLHESKCKNIHGHQYRVVLNCSGGLQEDGPSTGMVLDFSDLKSKILQPIHDKFDHGYIYWENDFFSVGIRELSGELGLKWVPVPFHPTAENLAKWCFNFAKEQVEAMDLACWVDNVEVFETPTSTAWYPA